MKPKLQLKTKVQVKQKLKLRRVIIWSSIAGGLSILTIMILIWINNLGYVKTMYSNENSLLSSFEWRKDIIVHSDEFIENDVLDFTLLLSFQEDHLRHKTYGGLIELLDGADISILNSNLTKKFNHKIKNYNPETGDLLLWVLVDTLYANKPTLLTMTFGNDMVSTINNNDSIWPDKFSGVWEFDDNNADASIFSNNPNTNQIPEFTMGRLMSAINPDGSTKHIHINKSSSFDFQLEGSISAWIYFDNYMPYGGIVHKGDKKTWTDEAFSLQLWNDERLLFAINDENSQQQLFSSKLKSNTWYHVVATWDQNGMKIFLNGGLDKSSNQSLIVRETSGGINIGAQLNQNYNNNILNLPFKGKIDEVSLISEAVTEDWVKANFNNIENPIDFITLGNTRKIDASLPVDLISFNGKYSNNAVKITWATFSEKNCSHFEVEKGYDGFTFKQIDEIFGAGNSSVRLDYSCIDNNIEKEIVFYRLKQVDFDGRYEFFGPISVKCESNENISDISVDNIYPNPFTEIINIELTSPLSYTIDVIITDMSGRIIFSIKENIEKGYNQIHLKNNLGKLTNGNYILKIKSDDILIKSSKILKN